jgi:superfamily II DNA/RNA helicase
LTVVDPRDKRETLRRLIRSEDVKNALIFCNRKRDVDILHKSLTRHGFDAAALHGDMAQPKRTETLERFKNGEVRLLVASDVAARGLDIKGMSHVFCFDVPIHAEDYVHRIGRTGRAGLSGRSFMLAAPEDGKAVAAIVKLIGKEIRMITVDGIGPAELEYEERRRRRSRPPGRAEAGRAEAGRAEAGRGEPRSSSTENRRKPTENSTKPGGEQGKRRNGRNGRASPAHPPARPDMQPAVPAEAENVMRFPRNPELRRPRPTERVAEDERRVVGFGDHLPAFLARPPRIVAGA